MKRFGKFLLVIALLVLLRTVPGEDSSTPGVAPAPGSIFLYPERIPTRDGQFITADRGMIFVPAKRKKKNSTIIGIEVYRFRAEPKEKGASKIPPVFQLQGGPGFEGLSDYMKNPRFFEFFVWPVTRTIGTDLVVVGQRGIGSSKPDTLIESAARFSPDEEVTAEQYAKRIRSACEKGKAFWEKQGLDLSGFTVVEAAADVNDVREALGYHKIILQGGSFGSHWGMAVMRFFPGIVERAVLSSLEGPDHTWDMPGWVLNSLRRIAAAAEEDPKLREHIPEGGLIAALEQVIARLEKEPVFVEIKPPNSKPVSVRVDARAIRRLALGYSSSVRGRQGMPAWPSDIIALHKGNYQKAAQYIYRRRLSRPKRTASYFLLDNASGISENRKRQLDADPAAYLLGDINGIYRSSSPVWEINLGDDFRLNFDTDIPTLLVHGTWDVSTPFENARQLAPHFRQGKLVEIIGGSHGAFNEAVRSSRDFKNAWIRFVRSGDLSGMPEKVTLPAIRWKLPQP